MVNWGLNSVCGCWKDSLSVSLKDVDRVDGRVSEVPQSKGGVSGWSDHQALGRVCAAVGQLLVMSCTQNHNSKHSEPYGFYVIKGAIL